MSANNDRNSHNTSFTVNKKPLSDYSNCTVKIMKLLDSLYVNNNSQTQEICQQINEQIISLRKYKIDLT